MRENSLPGDWPQFLTYVLVQPIDREDSFGNQERLRDCAEEIDSPYNRNKDAFMESEDDEPFKQSNL